MVGIWVPTRPPSPMESSPWISSGAPARSAPESRGVLVDATHAPSAVKGTRKARQMSRVRPMVALGLPRIEAITPGKMSPRLSGRRGTMPGRKSGRVGNAAVGGGIGAGWYALGYAVG